MGLVGALTNISADENGTVELDEDWYTLGTSATVTVTDSDEDVAIDQTQVITNGDLIGGGDLTSMAAFASVSFALTNAPLVGTPELFLGAGGVKGAAIVSTDLVIIAQTNANGFITIQTGSGGFTGGDLFVEYGQGIFDTVEVTVTSTSSDVGITVNPSEVDADSDPAADTGIFEIAINLVEGDDAVSSSTTLTLGVRNGDVITVKYKDLTDSDGTERTRTATARVEINDTIITNVLPTHETATQIRQPDFSGSLNDTESGVDVDRVYIIFDGDLDGILQVGELTGDPVFDEASENFIGTKLEDGTITSDDLDDVITDVLPEDGREIYGPDSTDPTTNAAVVDFDFNPPENIPFGIGGGTVADPDGPIDFFFVVFDVSGNVTVSDSDDDTPLLNEPHIVRVDALGPVIQNTDDRACIQCEYRTGEKWDAVDEEVDNNKRDWIRIIVSEKLDPASVSASDFTVDGLTPLDAIVFSDQQELDPIVAPADEEETLRHLPSVFIQLASRLDYNGEPVVDLSSTASIADIAGNVTSKALHPTIEDDDKIAQDKVEPSFTITLSNGSGGDDLTKDDIDIAITSTEQILGNLPQVELFNEAGVNFRDLAGVTPTGVPNEWEVTYSELGADPDGDISVVISGTDVNGNTGDEGDTDTEDSDAIVFELDRTIAAPAFFPTEDPLEPDFDTEIDDTSPVVTSTFGEDVTILEALFEEEGGAEIDVTAQVFSSDDEKWVYAASGLMIDGQYRFTITAEDDAGNEGNAEDTTFTVVERELIEVPLSSGQNLISVPGTPTNGDINSAGFPDDVSSVITYDPFAAGGPWLVATRGADGSLSGSLTTIDASHAYWVETNSFAPIEIDIPPQDFTALVDSAIPVVAGWNLVPVRSLTDEQPDNAPDDICGTGVGTGVAGCVVADRYFGSVDWITAFTFVTQTKTWVKLLPNQIPADTVGIGKGYWLYAAGAGTLVP